MKVTCRGWGSLWWWPLHRPTTRAARMLSSDRIYVSVCLSTIRIVWASIMCVERFPNGVCGWSEKNLLRIFFFFASLHTFFSFLVGWIFVWNVVELFARTGRIYVHYDVHDVMRYACFEQFKMFSVPKTTLLKIDFKLIEMNFTLVNSLAVLKNFLRYAIGILVQSC